MDFRQYKILRKSIESKYYILWSFAANIPMSEGISFTSAGEQRCPPPGSALFCRKNRTICEKYDMLFPNGKTAEAEAPDDGQTVRTKRTGTDREALTKPWTKRRGMCYFWDKMKKEGRKDDGT